jgi:hypothetical protein
MTDEPRRGIDGRRDEETASVMDDLGESGRAAVQAIMAEHWAVLRVARLVGLINGLEKRMEALEAEIRSLRSKQAPETSDSEDSP